MRELEKMKPRTILINNSRGKVIDQGALIAALDSGRIAGAALDVFDPEPLPRSSPLWLTPNLIITPHCGSDDSHYYAARTLDLVLSNTVRFLNGTRLQNIISRKTQY